jgi:hypothetical protein
MIITIKEVESLNAKAKEMERKKVGNSYCQALVD